MDSDIENHLGYSEWLKTATDFCDKYRLVPGAGLRRTRSRGYEFRTAPPLGAVVALLHKEFQAGQRAGVNILEREMRKVFADLQPSC